MIIALPDARHFDGDTQPRWEIRLKIGDRHLMFNLFQHAVTIAFYLFFCSARLASFCLYFYQFCHNINTNMIPLAPPSQEGIGEACLAPQGAAPAPPLQGGVTKAFLAPQGAPPSAAVAAQDDPTQRPRWRHNQQMTQSGGGGNNMETTRRGTSYAHTNQIDHAEGGVVGDDDEDDNSHKRRR